MIKCLTLVLMLMIPSVAYCAEIYNNLNDAKTVSQETQLPLLVIFSSDSCKFCKQLKTEMIDTDIVNQYTICILDFDEHRRLSRKFKISSLPTSIILDTNNDEIARITGYNRAAYLKWIGQETK